MSGNNCVDDMLKITMHCVAEISTDVCMLTTLLQSVLSCNATLYLKRRLGNERSTFRSTKDVTRVSNLAADWIIGLIYVGEQT